MRLTKQTGYAIRVLTAAARTPDVNVKIADFADELGITRQNALKIVNQMVHAGFVKATRGRSGGIMLARPAAKILIGEVVLAMEVTHVAVDVAPKGAGAGGRARRAAQKSSVNGVFDEALDAFIAVLNQHTIADMASLPATHPVALEPLVTAPAKRANKAARSVPKPPRRRSAVIRS